MISEPADRKNLYENDQTFRPALSVAMRVFWWRIRLIFGGGGGGGGGKGEGEGGGGGISCQESSGIIRD